MKKIIMGLVCILMLSTMVACKKDEEPKAPVNVQEDNTADNTGDNTENNNEENTYEGRMAKSIEKNGDIVYTVENLGGFLGSLGSKPHLSHL